MSENSRVIVITGATRGLGRAMTDKFIELGHHVAGCGRSASHVRQLEQRYGPPHVFRVADVRNERDVAQWVQAVLEQLGAPDLLLNNAAVINRNARLWELTAEEFNEVIDINVKGVMNVLRHFLPAMLARKRGVIVNFSSAWGRSTSPEVAPYCCSKFAIEGLTKSLAQELPSGMAAIPLNPGIIDTDMLRSCFGSSAAHYPSPEDWAELAVPFLLKLGPKDNGRSLSVPGS
ncbi:MAG: SDR family oxidoreductase [Gemmatales bacterium]|nr:SDR family oxidoreductase [Gemmatales bacterium]MDW8224035.1 SDR family oxidoreductase [Gemmatales bacterium]